MIHEQYSYVRSIESLQTLAEQSQNGASLGNDDEMRLQLEVDLLQCYAELVRGFSGYVGGLLLLSGIPQAAEIMSAHNQGLQMRDNSRLFPGHKMVCSFVPINFSCSEPNDVNSSGGDMQGKDTKVHCDVETNAVRYPRRGSTVETLEDLVRGRQTFSDRDFTRRSSDRMSRSLSPINARQHLSALQQGDINKTYADHHLSPRNVEQEQHSLVSDLVTYFSGPTKERAHSTMQQRSSYMCVEGSILIRKSSILSEDISSFASGGLRIWYPLLVMDSPRQVATLRIIASMISSSSKVYKDFEDIAMNAVILYCLYVTPLLASEASLQALFDITTQLQFCQDSVVHTRMLSKNEKICSIEFLVLSVHVAICSPCNIQLAFCTMEWLIGLCDDSWENITLVLDSLGIIPFLVMMSLWLDCEDMQLVENELPVDTSQNDTSSRSEYTIRMPCKKLIDSEKEKMVATTKGYFPDSIFSDQPDKLVRLQITIARFLKLLITGSNGELPPIRVAAAARSPCGFNVNHLQSLVNFVAYTIG